MILLLTDWSTAWLMAGMSVGVVFFILVLLVLVLQVFNMVSGSSASQKAEHEETNADEVAVATAVYLYLSSHHDEESGLLTIHVNGHSGWHEELNNRL